MLYDRYNRRIDYLRVSVTDRCNQQCVYCMPGGAGPWIPRQELLSFEEIRTVVTAAVTLGVTKIRLTGGEPLVRRGIVHLVAMLAAVDGLRELAMTTNGVLLEGLAQELRAAGLQRLNISLDTLDPERYARITGRRHLPRVLAGIRAAQAAGYTDIKLNCVIERSTDEPDAQAVARFATQHGLAVRFIRRMDRPRGEFWPVAGGHGGHCPQCNRLRLTSHGLVQPCLFSDLAFSVRTYGATEALRRAVAAKPATGMSCREEAFNRIGG